MSDMEEEQKKKRPWKMAGVAAVIALLLAGALTALWMLRDKKEEIVLLEPAGILAARDGSLYVADEGANQIIRVNGETKELVAGYALPVDAHGRATGGYRDGAWDEAVFNRPFALVEWNGGIAVSDSGNHCIRFIEQEETVRTLAGTGEAGCQNGYAGEATFFEPKGLAVGQDGCLYVADSGNGVLRRISKNGQVDTLVEGLDTPIGLCSDGDALYITDAGTNQILRWTEAEGLTVVAGAAYRDEERSLEDGVAEAAVFSKPMGVACRDGVLYVSDTGFSAVRRIRDGQVDTLSIYGGTGTNLWPGQPAGLIATEGTLYVADPFSGVLFSLNID